MCRATYSSTYTNGLSFTVQAMKTMKQPSSEAASLHFNMIHKFYCSFQWTHSKVISDLKNGTLERELEQKKHHMKGPKKLFRKWSFLVFNFIEGNCTFGKMWISFRARFSAYLSKKSNIVSKKWEYFLQEVLAPLQIW